MRQKTRRQGERRLTKATFVGLVGLNDPARADVPHAIAACRGGGIRVVMVTGDHAVTAPSIARSVALGEPPPT